MLDTSLSMEGLLGEIKRVGCRIEIAMLEKDWIHDRVSSLSNELVRVNATLCPQHASD